MFTRALEVNSKHKQVRNNEAEVYRTISQCSQSVTFLLKEFAIHAFHE